MNDYVAYHSSELMGCEYWPDEQFHFSSRKTEKFLRRAIGCRVWVIVSTGKRAQLAYWLAGVFTPSEVLTQEDSLGIRGVGTPFRPPFEVKGLPWFSELLREQNEFSFGFNRIQSPSVVTELELLLQRHGGESVLQPDEVAIPSVFTEGATRQVSVNSFERNPLARQRCIEHYGCRCAVCGFDFEKVYGELGSGFIHVHHLKPLSEIRKEYVVDPILDLRPVCPNCHAMIHRRSEMLDIETLKAALQG